MQKTCYFFGTDKMPSAHTVYTKLYCLMKKMVEKEKVTVFILGCSTLFDSVACVAAVKTKERYPHIQIDINSQDTECILSKCTHIAVLSYNDCRDKLKKFKKENKNLKIYHLIS